MAEVAHLAAELGKMKMRVRLPRLSRSMAEFSSEVCSLAVGGESPKVFQMNQLGPEPQEEQGQGEAKEWKGEIQVCR